MTNVPASTPVPGPEQSYAVVARLVVERVIEDVDKRVHVARCDEISIELEPIVTPRSAR